MRAPIALFVLCAALHGCNCGQPRPPGEEGNDGGGGSGGGGGTGGGGGSAGLCIDGLQALALSPANRTDTVGSAPGPVTFSATGTFTNGGTQDVSTRLTWSASRDDDTPPGQFIAPGSYQPQPGAGGTVTLKATDGCITAQTTITFRLETTFKNPGDAVTARFNGTVVTGSSKSPAIVYPSDQTRFPRNIYKILFQWKKAGNDYFRLTFEGTNSKAIVFSDGAHVQCQAAAASSGCMEADLDIWLAIAGSNAGAATTLTIDGVTQGDPNVYRSGSIQIGFSKRDVKGAIFYWSTTAAGIRRASVSDLDPESYLVAKPVPTVLPNNNGEVKCVACHTVSRSGQKMFAYTQAGSTGEFVYNVTPQPPPLPLITTQISTAKGFGTFRPDDKRVVATLGSLLAEFNAETGAKIVDLPVAAGTNPDWSPTSTELAYSDRAGDSPGSANLKVITYDAGTWGVTRTVVPAGGLTNLFPSYSPDGTYIAYARGKGGHGDRTLQLWLVKADGSEPPIELSKANRVVNGETGAGQHENNMPTWAPPGDLLWVAFNSVRPYGVVYPTGGVQQIWVTAIDPAKLGKRQTDGGMVDPSYPGFRFAFQGIAENNHRAFWTLDVRDPPDAGPTCAGLGSACGAGVTCCAPTTCTPSAELGQTCQLPSDGGACIPNDAPCSQTSGASCCGSSTCDTGPDGGMTCRAATIN